MQTTYNLGPGNPFAGMLSGISPARIVTRLATTVVNFGRGIFKQYGYQEQGRLPVESQCVITDDGGTFTAGNIVTTVNGTAITTAFGTDKNTTMTAHAAAIAAGVSAVSSCAYSAGAHTITIQTRNTSLVVSCNVSGITGTMTISSTVNTSLDSATTFVGVACHDHAREQSSTGVAQYAANEAMSVLMDGEVYVTVEETVTADDAVYVRTMTNGAKLAGMFGKTSTSGETVALTNCRFTRGGTTTQPALLLISNP